MYNFYHLRVWSSVCQGLPCGALNVLRWHKMSTLKYFTHRAWCGNDKERITGIIEKRPKPMCTLRYKTMICPSHSQRWAHFLGIRHFYYEIMYGVRVEGISVCLIFCSSIFSWLSMISIGPINNKHDIKYNNSHALIDISHRVHWLIKQNIVGERLEKIKRERKPLLVTQIFFTYSMHFRVESLFAIISALFNEYGNYFFVSWCYFL